MTKYLNDISISNISFTFSTMSEYLNDIWIQNIYVISSTMTEYLKTYFIEKYLLHDDSINFTSFSLFNNGGDNIPLLLY